MKNKMNNYLLLFILLSLLVGGIIGFLVGQNVSTTGAAHKTSYILDCRTTGGASQICPYADMTKCSQLAEKSGCKLATLNDLMRTK